MVKQANLLLTKQSKTVLIIAVLLGLLIWWTDTSVSSVGTVKYYDRNGMLLYESRVSSGSKIYAQLSSLPHFVPDAFISIEDTSFWKNPGFDIAGILRAVYLNTVKGQITAGGSTITQQYVRSAIFEKQTGQKRNYLYKIREILTAVRVTIFGTKAQILEGYLNELYLGRNSYGVESASLAYFGKSASTLSLSEAAYLAGLASSPEYLGAPENFDKALEKRNQVLELMFKNNYISDEEKEVALGEKLFLSADETQIHAPHFVNFVSEELENLSIKKTGISVYTTLDLALYDKARQISRLWVTRLNKQHNITNAALILLDNKTGEVLVMMGGVNYFDYINAGNVNMTTALRQPGSAIKPVTYLAALMGNFTAATPILDTEKVFTTRKGTPYVPRNYDNKYHGLVSLRTALASSLNMPAVEVLNQIGFDSFFQTARDLGITTFKRVEDYDLALTLGGGEVTLLELANAYATISRQGSFIPTYSLERVVEDRTGKVLYSHNPEHSENMFGEKGAYSTYILSDILSDPVARIPGFGEKNFLVLSRKAAVKTGTTTDWHDTWTVGYTPEYTVGVWVGNNNNDPMTEISGVTGAAPIWNYFFEELFKERNTTWFQKPSQVRKLWVCKAGAELADGCPERYEELFIAGSTLPDTGIQDDKVPSIRILSPLSLAKYQVPGDGQVSNSGLVFEVAADTNINRLKWFLDGKEFASWAGKQRVVWQPEVGGHSLYLVGEGTGSKSFETGVVNFEVID